MKPIERIAMLALLATAFVLICVKSFNFYIDNTKLVPTTGGTMTDAVYGEVKFLNPILAQSDAERTVSKLLFSGLIKLDGSTIMPDLAEKWEISPEGTKYTFFLRRNAVFHDGQPVTTRDIAYTVDAIKAPELKSPLLSSWSDVTATVIDDYTVSFDLPKSYGPFIYNCAFGVLPSHLPSDEFSKKFIGSGPYKYVKADKKSSLIKGIELERFEGYYLAPGYISEIKLNFYANQADAKSIFETEKSDLLSGVNSDAGKRMTFRTSKKLQLILNIKDTQLANKDLRQKLLTGQNMAEKVSLRLASFDTPYQREKAEELKRKLALQNVELTTDYYNSLKMQDILTAHNYQLLLYGFDFGYDRDPYVYWHSTQAEKMNFSGWGDKKTDILLEDARMITDTVARNAKYDEFFGIIDKEYLYQDFEPVEYSFEIGPKIKGVAAVTGIESNSRYNNVADWFIKEKRTKK